MINIIRRCISARSFPEGFDVRLSGFLERMEAQLRQIVSRAPARYQPSLDATLFSGKRLRPVLLFACGWGSSDPDCLLTSMTVIELLHCASLIHDDIIDRGTLRHGKPTPYSLLGSHDALLCGDYVLSCVLDMLSRFDWPDICRELNSASRQMCLGEIQERQIAFHAELHSIEKYYQIADNKTGSLLRAACVCGGILSGRPPEQLDLLRRYGTLLGRTFQIKDDLLDYMPAEASTKKTGLDMASGIATLPMLLALDRNRDPQIYALLNAQEKGPDVYARLYDFVMENHGLNLAQEQAELYCRAALDAAHSLPNSEIFTMIANSLLYRNN